MGIIKIRHNTGGFHVKTRFGCYVFSCAVIFLSLFATELNFAWWGNKMDKNDSDEKLETLSKFMVSPSNYEIYKFGGISLKNEEWGMQLMLQYFPEHFTEELLRKNMQRYNLESMFTLVKKYFKVELNYSVRTDYSVNKNYLTPSFIYSRMHKSGFTQ